ncbi:MAG: MgtC/SapB family protein [Bacteroidota bacterium]|jgi:putative Mg2+ transporter-C (MgtC) family protein
MQIDYEILLRFFFAALWGGIVGAERQYRSKSAGFRTMIMISIGACFFTMMSMLIGAPASHDRIASNIVTGIGFLGAGVIFRGENRINGITTAATIWAVAAVGMGIGAGFYFAASCASILIFLILAVLPYLENYIEHLNLARTYSISLPYSENLSVYYEKKLKANKLKYRIVNHIKNKGELMLVWETQGHAKNHAAFITKMLEDTTINKFEYF